MFVRLLVLLAFVLVVLPVLLGLAGVVSFMAAVFMARMVVRR